jgi:hypothetical protein
LRAELRPAISPSSASDISLGPKQQTNNNSRESDTHLRRQFLRRHGDPGSGASLTLPWQRVAAPPRARSGSSRSCSPISLGPKQQTNNNSRESDTHLRRQFDDETASSHSNVRQIVVVFVVMVILVAARV